VRTVRPGPVIGLIVQLALLVALEATVGLGAAGWVVGTACGVTTATMLARGLARDGAWRLGPADRVTLVRSTLVGSVAALVADSFARPVPVAVLVSLTVVALVLDAVDGWVARRTGTITALGARFDMEVDAFLILVLAGYVAGAVGWWVLTIGAARYALAAAGWLLPWLQGTLPQRRWCKVVAATQGIVLTVAAAALVPALLVSVLLAASLGLLAESFGREVWGLWRQRSARLTRGTGPVAPEHQPGRDVARRSLEPVGGDGG